MEIWCLELLEDTIFHREIFFEIHQPIFLASTVNSHGHSAYLIRVQLLKCVFSPNRITITESARSMFTCLVSDHPKSF